jgi:hypothetical protein
MNAAALKSLRRQDAKQAKTRGFQNRQTAKQFSRGAGGGGGGGGRGSG